MPLGAIVEAVVATPDVEASARFVEAAFGLSRLHSSPLLGVSGVASGRVRFEKVAPDGFPPPRIWETGPRLLGIYSRDLNQTKRLVESAGGAIGPLVSYPYGAGTMSEAVVRAPHNLLWTVPQPASRRPSPALDADEQRLHGELHSAVINVTDVDSALRFFVGAGGLTSLFDGVLSGEPFERMMGLPAGVSLRIAFLAAQNQAPARLELMQFFDTPREPGHKRTMGLSRLVFSCPKDDIEATRDRLLAAGGAASPDGRIIGPAGIILDFADPDSIEA